MDVIAAVPPRYQKVLVLKLKAKPTRTACQCDRCDMPTPQTSKPQSDRNLMCTLPWWTWFVLDMSQPPRIAQIRGLYWDGWDVMVLPEEYRFFLLLTVLQKFSIVPFLLPSNQPLPHPRPSPHNYLCPWVMQICSLINLFQFPYPFPSGTCYFILFFTWFMPLNLFCSSVYLVH